MNVLHFVRPVRPLIDIGLLVFPKHACHPSVVERGALLTLAKSQSMWRNVVALYLRAAQVPAKDIANFLSLSPSRTLAVINVARERILKQTTAAGMKNPIARDGREFTEEEISAHRLLAAELEMTAAETALSTMVDYGSDSRTFVISGALSIGRERFEYARRSLNGITCSCLVCKIVKSELAQIYESRA